MNVLKNMEAAFVATVALAVSSLLMSDSIPVANAQPVVTSGSHAMAVVVVTAKRMSAEEKLKSVQTANAAARSFW